MKPAGKPTAVVIGGGFGGLAAGVRLAARGYRVNLLEKMEKPGGKAYVINQDGFVFDAGPTVVTAPHLFEELWSLAGRRMKDDIELRQVDPLYMIRFHDGTSFRYIGDPVLMKEEIARFAPQDLEGYDRYTSLSERIFRLGFEGLVDQPFLKWSSMARIVPSMIRLKSYRTVYGLVSRFVRHEKLRQVLTFHTLLVGGNPYSTTSIYCLISQVEQKWGVHFPKGGTGALVRGLVGLIESMDGTVRTKADVVAITLDGRRATGVCLNSGEIIPADLVVSNVDASWTYRYLLPEKARRRWTNRRIERQKHSMSCFLWYFGTRRRYPEVAHHTILLGQRYRGLLRDIFDRKVLADDFSLYLHRPTATDPALAPKGCDAFYALSPVPNLESGIDWPERAEPYRKSIARTLSDTMLPDLETELVTSAVMTPKDFLDRTNSYQGATFSLQPLLTQSAYFRPHNRSEEVDNLYLVGAGTHPGAGLPGVLASARVLDRLIPPANATSVVSASAPTVFLYQKDLRTCRMKLRSGSKSFSAANHLLPRRIRSTATALYAFCREADDAIDLTAPPRKTSLPPLLPFASTQLQHNAIDVLHERLERVYANNPENNPVDRAFCRVVHTFCIPQELFLAMFEGFQWDALQRRYETLEELEGYCARVASTVGVMMTLLMGSREPGILARACDLGLAMQLTNICRDVGEDAVAGRIYLPLVWLQEAGIDPDAFLAKPRFNLSVGKVIKRLLDVADAAYARADPGIELLPKDCRLAICAARSIYADIGSRIRKNAYDSISQRAYTSKSRKLSLILRSLRFGKGLKPPNPEPARPAVQFLIDAVCSPSTHSTRHHKVAL